MRAPAVSLLDPKKEDIDVFFFQAEDGIRDIGVTGVQTCALPIFGPSDFDLPYGWEAAKPLLRTIFDRTLLRAGETVHMKHVYRLPTASGFRSGGAVKGTLVLQHRGFDTKFELPLTLDGNGIGENDWTPPKGSPMGDYEVSAKIGDTVL